MIEKAIVILIIVLLVFVGAKTIFEYGKKQGMLESEHACDVKVYETKVDGPPCPPPVEKDCIYVMADRVYYDTHINRFCQARKRLEHGWEVSCANFYNDSKTSIFVHYMSDKYIAKHFRMVGDMSKYCKFEGTGWRVKEVGE